MKNNTVCYIVGASDFNESFEVHDGDFVIAADGGYDQLIKNGIVPNVLIGDLDSVQNVPSDVEVIRFPIEKDETDMHLAYRLGFERGYRNFAVFGGTGGRLDHTLANLSLLYRAKLEGSEMRLIGSGYEIRVIKNELISLLGKPGSTVSVFAIGGEAHGVFVRGLKYEAEDVTLAESFALGVSNSFTETGRGSVSVNNGALLVMTEFISEKA